MEKLKNILSPGHKQDDELLYGADQSTHPSTHPTHAGQLSGEGSHLKEARDTTSTLPDRKNPESTKDTSLERQTFNPASTKHDETRYGTTGTSEPTHTPVSGDVNEPVGGTSQSSRLGTAATGTERDTGNLLSAQSTAGADDISVASVRSGIIGEAPQSKQLTDAATPVGSGTDRSFPLAGGAVGGGSRAGDFGTGEASTTTSGPGTAGVYDRDQSAALGGPVGDRYGGAETAGTHDTHDSHGREALAGAAAAATVAEHEHHGHGHKYEGPNTNTAARTGPQYTSGPHVTDTANRLDPHIGGGAASTTGQSGAFTSTDARAPGYDSGAAPSYGSTGAPAAPSSGEHHYGRDAAVAGGATAAGAGLYEAHRKGSTDEDPASKTHGPHKSNIANIADPRVLPDSEKIKGHHAQSTETDPASFTTGPHKSNVLNILDPRVLPEPEKMKQHTTSGSHQSDMLNRADPRVNSDVANEAGQQDQHHYGRDAALAGGAGAAGLGAYEAEKHHKDTAGPHQSDTLNRADPRVDSDRSQENKHHYGRDAALAGGAGTAGLGSYEADKHHRDTAGPHQSDTLNRADPRVDSDRSQENKHHYGRDAALAGGAGVGAAGAYEAAKHHDNPYSATAIDPRVDSNRANAPPRGPATATYGSTATENQPVPGTTGAIDHANQPEQHHYGRDAAGVGAAGVAGAGAAHEYSKHEAEKAEKERLKEQKAHNKELEKAEKKHEKELEKAEKKHEKKHEKELAKEEKKHEKELAKEEKKHEKEEKKHGHGILGFLHRDKDKDKHAEEPTTTHDTTTTDRPDTAEQSTHHAEEAILGAGAAGVGAGAYEAENEKRDRNRLHKEPPNEFAAAQAYQTEHSGTVGGLGQPGAASEVRSNDPNIRPIGDNGIVTEPHTGLPMDVGKYGTGAGGTDASKNIMGWHTHPTGTGVEGANTSTGSSTGHDTDWEKIKKGNTLY